MKKINKVSPFLLLFFVFVVIIFSFRDNPFSKVLSGHDSSMFLYFGKGISDGLVPYKDMLDHKGPVLFIIEYLAVLIGFGNIPLGIWVLECLFLIGSITFLYKTNRLYTDNKLIASVSVAFLMPLFILCYDGGNYSEEFALLFISCAFYLFSKIIIQNKKSKIEYMLIGILGALTFFIRVNMISLWVVFCLYLVFINVHDKKYSILIQQIKGIFLGGFLTTMAIILVSLLQNNLKQMFHQAFVMNILYSESDLIGKLETARSFIELLLKTGTLPMVLIFFISFLSSKRELSTKVFIVLSSYFLLNFFTVVLSGRYYTHYLITQFAPLAVVLSLSIQFITTSIVNKKKLFLASMLLLLTTLPASIPAIETYNLGFKNYSGSEVEQIKGISKFIKENSSQNDTIYVHNINANIYLLSDRYSNSRFFVLPAINYDKFPEMQSEFSKEMKSNPPKFIVIRKQLLSDKQNSSNMNNVVFSNLENKYHSNDKIITDNYILYELNK
ncbi:prepilin-type cleavage/methylation protein [Enterococcus gilvus]|jgi:hypothetical protein|uniref:prepilin-type cleavage/methylation protein n=1 Tax=Enterococcus gilvus TaxID=160453 RepID=UPI000DF5C6D8|nr:prepilin-type cleavage/methylation protein [Enterococcus gilvus]AXG38649.1 prepilin-type cleavage/methylation protein [Enterococcus gilvus]